MTAEFRLQLRQLRQTKELSQEELAKALGISRQSIISLEQGQYWPSFPLLVDLIRFFNCSMDQLVEGIELHQSTLISQPEEGGEEPMAITPWSPFQAIDQLQDEMTDAVERTFGRGDWSRTFGPSVGALNIHEDEKEYELEIQVPGYAEGDVNVELADDMLTVSGAKKQEKKDNGKSVIRREWEQSEFSRTLRFAQPIKADKAEAKIENGTLTITIPKVQPIKPKTTKIAVKKQ
jgi:HSP20 family protein